jgi:hypothetical protein
MTIWLAAISACAALAGAGIAGGLTYLTSVRTQNEQQSQEDRRLDEEVRGAARALADRLATDISYSEAILVADDWLFFSPRYVAPFRPADFSLVMGRLTSAQYRAVDVALRDEASFLLLDEARRVVPFRAKDRVSAKNFKRTMERGLRALGPLIVGES